MVSTGILGKPAIAYTKPSYMTMPTNAKPDQADTTNVIIPMILSAYSPPKKSPKTNLVTSLPITDIYTGTTWGGSAVSHGPMELPKITLDGTIDTPMVNLGGWMLSQLKENVNVGQRFTYAEFIQACLEGRIAYDTNQWLRQDPIWFRDPYGRRYDNPRILDFSASFVESVPGRTSFQMTMVAS